VTPRILDAVVEELANLVIRRYLPGDGLEPDAQIGPVVSDDQLTSNLRYLELAKDEGGDLVTGAEAADGLYQTPAIVTGVTSGHTLAREEVFGPVVAVMAVSDLEEAIAVANDVPFGLSAGVVTNDLRAAHRFAAEVAAGVVKVNRPTSGLDLNVPFGGVKESSTNTYREQGQGALDFYTWTKSVYVGID
jgi:aldehyde dehydrogenase (NAD+)